MAERRGSRDSFLASASGELWRKCMTCAVVCRVASKRLAWLSPSSVLQPRFWKFSVQVDF